ncbi:MAG TPA: PQQ-dependent sugar dehydrogenase [Geminicoccaceae bacterium]|nr:PQQ-dependent sugar dehydrogenase [Geminicoccaceae bacterium]
MRAHLESLNLPPGFEIGIFAEVPGARWLARDPASGAIAVGTWSGEVYGVWDQDGDGAADSIVTRLEGLKVPNRVAFHDGYLYVAEQHRLARYPVEGLAPERQLDAAAEVIFDSLLDTVNHGWRCIGFGPDGKLYVAVGVACNICDFEEPEGSILRMDPDGANVETFARGIRNSVGFDFHPDTAVLHFTNNGTDDIDDNEPADEFNAAPEAGMHFGFPYYAGGRHPDWADRRPPQEVTFLTGVCVSGAHRATWRRVLHGRAVSGGIPGRRVRGPARLVEPLGTDRLSDHTHPLRRRRERYWLRAVHRRLAGWPLRLGPAGGCARTP